MKKLLLSLLCLALTSCAPLLQVMPGFAHTAFLPLGASKMQVLPDIEHILGSPHKQFSMKVGNLDEIKVERYRFTVIYDFVMYFYKSTFIQAGLMGLKSEDYPPIRSDYAEVTQESPGPVVGYVLSSNGVTRSIDTIWQKGMKPRGA